MADLITLIASLLMVVVILGFYVSWRATRLDRLHARIETARAALDAALLRRCASVLELASSGFLDPASSLVLAQAEQDARLAVEHDQREFAESRLSHALRAVCGEAEVNRDLNSEPPLRVAARKEFFSDVESANRKVSIARHFYNDAITATIGAHRKMLARVLRLAGHAQIPSLFEMDDSIE
jgi:hypothetical protein